MQKTNNNCHIGICFLQKLNYPHVFGSISNTSTGIAGFDNFTALSANVARNSAYTIAITLTRAGTVYSEGYAVFINSNQYGDFQTAAKPFGPKQRLKRPRFREHSPFPQLRHSERQECMSQ